MKWCRKDQFQEGSWLTLIMIPPAPLSTSSHSSSMEPFSMKPPIITVDHADILTVAAGGTLHVVPEAVQYGNGGLNWWGGGIMSSALLWAGRGTSWGGGGHVQERIHGRVGGRREESALLPSSHPSLSVSLCITVLWPPSWCSAGPGVTWSPSAPGQGPPRGGAGSARSLWQERRLQRPDYRARLVQGYLEKQKSQFCHCDTSIQYHLIHLTLYWTVSYLELCSKGFKG